MKIAWSFSGIFCLLSCFAIRGVAFAQDTTSKPKSAGDAFKNVQVLKDIPEDQWFGTMSFFDDALGVNCNLCHVNPFESDKKPAKLKARQMIQMVREMNTKYFDGAPRVTCNSCHRGTLHPAAVPDLDVKHWEESAMPEPQLPDAEELIRSYLKAVGLDRNAEAPAERLVYTTTTYLWQQPPSTSETQLTSAGPQEVHITTQGSQENHERIRNGINGWQSEGKGWSAMNRFQMAEAAREASIFDGVSLLKDTAEPRTVRIAQVGGRETFVVEAKEDGDRVWLYFDRQSGLLVRERMFFQSFFADGCWDIELDDYRRVGRITLPYEVRILNPGGNGLTVRKVKERALLPSADGKLFEKPLNAR